MLRSLLVGLVLCSTVGAAEQIVGNTPLNPAPSTYTILALPANYQADAASVDLVNGFNSNKDLVAIRENTSFVAYEDGHPEFEQRWQGYLPEVSQGQPVVLVMDGNQVLYKRTGANAKQVSYELRERKLLNRLRDRRNNRRNPDEPQPGPLNCTPQNPTQPVNPIPDSPIDGEYPEEEVDEANTGAAVAVLVALGAAVWAGVFAFRSQ